MAIEIVNIRGFTSCDGFTPSALDGRYYNTYQFFTYGTDCRRGSAGDYFVNTETLKIKRYNSDWIQIFGVNDYQIGEILCRPSDQNFYGFMFAIDRATQKGTIFGCFESTSGLYKYQVDSRCMGNGSAQYNSNAIYNAIIGAIQPSYNWQSVPSISGKNGISQPLSSHLDINNGEPITTSDTTKYSLNSNSNINKLVQDKLNS